MHLSLLSDDTTKAICWTLVHSTWEGTGAALLAGLVILCTRKQPARVRYDLLSGVLLLFLLVAAGTFCYELSRTGDTRLRGAGAVTGIERSPDPTTIPYPTITVTQSQKPASLNDVIHVFENYLNTQATLITLIWVFCLSIQLLRLAGGLYRIDRLRRSGIAPGHQWDQKISILAARLGIKRSVTLLQSKLIKAPSALGFLKPSILVPLGLLSQLAPDQVEAILLHELAHIRRNDYLTNLLLHLAEAIFFFNPGIRWVATVIRREREACCDDMVLAGTSDKNCYFEALLAFMQYAIDHRPDNAPAYALRLSGRSGSDLTWRIRRMLTNENKKLHLMEKTILSLGLLALVSFGTIRATIQPAPRHTPKTTAPATAVLAGTKSTDPALVSTVQNPATAAMTQTAPAAATTAAVTTAASTEAAAPAPVAVIAAAAAPAPPAPVPPVPAVAAIAPMPPVPPSDTIPKTAQKTIVFTNFTGNTTEANGHKIFEAHGVNEDNGDRYEIKEVNDEVTEFKVNGEPIAPENYDRYQDIIAAMIGNPGYRGAVGSNTSRGEIGSNASRGEIGPNTSRGAVGPNTSRGAVGPNASRGEVGSNTSRGEVGSNTSRGAVGHAANPPYLTSNPVTLAIIADLQSDNLIDHLNPLSISLSGKSMTVNGVRQPDNIFEQYKAKYLKSDKDYVRFSQSFDSHHSSSSEHVNIDDGP